MSKYGTTSSPRAASTSPPPSPTILYDSEREREEREFGGYFDGAGRRRSSGARAGRRRRSSALSSSAGGGSPTAGSSGLRRVRSRGSSLLAPPDVPALLRAKRRWWRREWVTPRGAKIALMVASVGMSAVQANGVYSWPTYGPVVSKTLGLNTTEAQTIVVGGILGVYLCAAPLGSLTDRFGPRTASLLSACFSATGYFSFASVLNAGADAATANTYLVLTACYFAVGAATVGSYFAALTTASLSFPSHPTLSLSLPLSLIGLSSLFLSSFSTLPAFETPSGDLNAVRYLTFLGCMSVGVNLFGAMFMRVVPPIIPEPDDISDDDEADAAMAAADLSASLHLDERTPLLIGGPEAAREEVEAEAAGKHVRWTAMDLLRDPSFWSYGLILALCIGPAETLIATIGSVLTSLLPPEAAYLPSASAILAMLANPVLPSSLPEAAAAEPSALKLRNKHVFILSITSTLARLVTGFAADWLCPAPVAIPAPYNDDDSDDEAPTHYFVQREPIRLHRSAFAAICCGALGLVYAWNAEYLDNESKLWVLSGGVGAMYGAVFTLTPALTSSRWGPTNFGLAWGAVSYFPALGSAVFSYLYAYLAESESVSVPGAMVDPTICYGEHCFDTSLWIAAVCAGFASVGLFVIGRKWGL